MRNGLRAIYPGTPGGVRALRRELSAVAGACGMDEAVMTDMRIAVTEAATNAVVHGYDETEGGLDVSAELREGELLVVIADAGRGISAGRKSRGAGLGLPLIASLTSRFRVHTGASGTEVHMAFPCPDAAA